jgi:tetratricopeptide (TPR) repeat protein
MSKDNILHGIIGLLGGLIIGYLGTNYINRSAPTEPAAAASSVAPAPGSSEIPPDHPPTAGGQAAGGGMQGEVAATLERAKAAPEDYDAQMKAGELYSQIKRYDQAVEYFQRAQKARPSDFAALVSLGNANFDLEKFREAQKWYGQALKVRANDVNVRTDLGLAYFLDTPKDIDRAIAAYKASLGYDPRHEKTLQNLITALIEKGDKGGARGYLTQLEKVNSENAALAKFREQLNTP